MEWFISICAILIGVGAIAGLCDQPKKVRQNWLISVALALFVASVIYSPQRIHTEGYNPLPSNPYSTFVPAVDRVQYAWIWDAPENSSLEFGRLAVTWLAIAAVGAGALYVNQNFE